MLEQEAVGKILKPLIQAGVYKDEISALKDIILDYIDRKKGEYDRIISNFRGKYKKDFTTFTKDIRNSANLETEDDWMEWKGAIEVRKGWQEAYNNLLHGKTL